MIPHADMQALIGEDRRLQRRIWRWQRFGWVVMAAMLIAATLGLTGAGGLFGSASLNVGPHRIDLPRVMRWDADEELVIHLAPGAEETEIALGGDFARHADIRTLTPEPAENRSAGGQIIYRFAREARPAQVIVRFRMMQPDPAMRLVVSVDGQTAMRTLPVLP